MNKLLKKLFLVTAVLGVMTTSLAFVACGDNSSAGSDNENKKEESEGNNSGEGNTNGNTEGNGSSTNNLYVFEAEDTDLTGKIGAGYSGSATEEGLIAYATDCSASNDRYLTYLYKTNLSIDFVINSTEDVSNVTLSLRLSCEMQNITLTSDIYSVQVTTADGKTVNYTYDSISLKWSGDKGRAAEFKDYVISTKVKLAKGDNTIKLITNNNVVLGGTATATAPLVDCIKLTVPQTSQAVLSMEKATGNY
jgi:hypothetical protein